MKVTVGFSLDKDVSEKVKDFAEMEGRSVSSYVNFVLRKHIEKLEKENKNK